MKKPLILPLIATISTLLFLPIATAQLSNSKSKSHTSALVTAQATSGNLRKIAQAITVKVYAGDSRASGILIAKNGQAYTLLTNAHVVNRGKTYRIQTPDGKVYQARLINKGDSLRGNDLAVLQFQATVNYEIASFGDSSALAENQEVYTVGFPFDQKNLSFTAGKISLIADKPLVGGYQIGYTNETVQGMSGGAVLNREGKLIGVIGMGAAAILNDAYVYQDGTKPNETALAELRESSFAVPIATLAKVAPQLIAIIPKPDNQETTANLTTYTGKVADVDKIAQQITVRIDASNKKENGNGSGVIIAREGQTYYVLTAAHVVQDSENKICPKDKYHIVTHDGQQYPVQPTAITCLEGVDLAVVKFQSQEIYKVATLGNYDIILNKGQLIFVSGFPGVNTGTPKRILTAGAVFSQELTSVLTKEPATLTGGYELLYTNLSRMGMSGGPILDHQGRVIGINAASDNESIQDQQVSVGIFSFGIPISTFLGRVKETRIKLEDMNRETSVPNEISETEVNAIFNQLLTLKHPLKDASEADWLNYGNELLRSFKLEDSLTALNQAIKLNPKLQLHQAYYLRGLILSFQGKSKEALDDFDEATRLNSNYPQAWRMKSSLLSNLKKYPEALKAIDKAIEMQLKFSKPADKIKLSFTFYPLRIGILTELERYQEALEYSNKFIDTKKYAIGYILRGSIYLKLKDYEKVFADLNKAIELKPNNPNYYLLRGSAYLETKENQKAFADLNKAITLQPSNAELYINRAIAYQEVKDTERAMADYDKAIELDPKNPERYITRAKAYQELKDNERAMPDYNKAIELDPKKPEHYITRARAYQDLEENEKALTDYNKAIQIKPHDPWNYIWRGYAYQRMFRYQDALDDFNKAIEIDPKNPDPDLYNVRCSAYQEYDEQKAISDCTKAIELDSNNPKRYLKRAEVYFKSKNYQFKSKGFDDLNKAIEVDPKNPNLYMARSEAYSNFFDYQNAINDATKAIEFVPNCFTCYFWRAFSYRQMKENEKALADYNKIIELEPIDPYNYNIRAEFFLELKDYQKAFADYTKAIEFDPKNPERYLKRAEAYWTLKDYQKAFADYTKAIEFDPKNPERYLTRAEAYWTLKDYQKAFADYTKAIEFDPKNPERYLKRAEAYWTLKDYQKAFADYTKAIEFDPKNPERYLTRAKAYWTLKDYQKAFADYTKAIEFDPKNPERYLTRAKAYLVIKDYKKVIADYNKAINIISDSPTYYIERGDVYLELKDYQNALADYIKAVEIYDNWPAIPNSKQALLMSYTKEHEYEKTRLKIVRTYLNFKDYQKAIVYLTKIIQQNPNVFELYFHRGSAYLELKDYKNAIADLTKAIEIMEKDKNSILSKCAFNDLLCVEEWSLYVNRGLAYKNQQDYLKAIKDFNKAAEILKYNRSNQEEYKRVQKYLIELASKNPEPYIEKAKAYYERGDSKNALANYTKAIEIAPQESEFYIGRAQVYLWLKNYRKAFVDYNKAISLDSENSVHYIIRAKAYLKVKDYQKAFVDYNKAILLDFENSWYYMDRAEAYLKVKDYQKAFADYNKAIEIKPDTFSYINRAKAYLEIKNYQKAFADYNKAIEIKPDTFSYIDRAEAYLKVKDYQKAFTDYNKAIEIEPHYDFNYIARAKAYLEIKDYQNAFADYNKAIERYYNPSKYIHRAEAYLEIKDYQNAFADYTKIINFEPNNPIFYNIRGLAYFRSQNYQQSILDYDKALELQPDYADSYYNRGLAYKELKNSQKAIIDIQKAVQIYLQQDNKEGYQEAQNVLINLQKLL